MSRFTRWTALAVATLLSSPAWSQGDAEVPGDLAAVVQGVDTLTVVDTVGGVTCFGPAAWPVLVADDVPVLAAAQAGPGRILALTQGALLEHGGLQDERWRRLMQQALRWVAGGKRKPSVGVVGMGVEFLANSLGLKLEGWLEADVILASAEELSPELMEALRTRLDEGGGLLVATPPWIPVAGEPRPSTGRDSTLNRLMEPYGLCLDERALGAVVGDNLDVLPLAELPGMLRADRAWRALAGGERLELEEKRRALATLEGALRSLSDHEPTLMLPVRRALASGATGALDAPVQERLRRILEERELAPVERRFGPWYLVGPFDPGRLGREGAEWGEPLKVDAELAHCGANAAGPELAKEWKGAHDKRAWTLAETWTWDGVADVGELDLHELGRHALGRKAAKRWDRTGALVLYRELVVERPTAMDLVLAGSRGLQAWIDGELVAEDYAVDGEASVELPLRLDVGRHHLWVRTVSDGGTWSLRCSADHGAEQELVAVDEAIDRGVAWLTGRQLIDGSWAEWSGYGPGFTALCLFALGKSGLTHEHPAVRRGLAYLETHPAAANYSLSTVLLAWSEYSQAPRSEPIAEVLAKVADRLADTQRSTGLWSYTDDDGLPGDLSNTLFAALALDAAAQRGVPIPERVWQELAVGCVDLLEAGGGAERRFLYAPGETYGELGVEDLSFGSTTAAGLTALLLAKRGLGGEPGRLIASRVEKAIARSRAWIEGHMMWSRDPDLVGVTFEPWDPHYFWIYGVERVGTLLETATLGGQSWYERGAEYLLGAQREDGAWRRDEPALDTGLALLFLGRASLPMSRRFSSRDWRLAGSSGDAGLILRVRRPAAAGDALVCWLQNAAGGGLEAVDWIARNGAGEEVLATVTAAEDPGEALFAARVAEPPALGFELVARGRTSGGATIESAPLAIEPLYRPFELELAYAIAKNLLSSARVEAPLEASRAPAAFAVDATCATAWTVRAEAVEPTWSAELSDPVAASRLVLLHGSPRRADQLENRVRRVRVRVDGGAPIEAELHPDPLRPTVIQLGEGRAIERVELTVLRLREPVGEAGFSEILLLP